MYRWCVAAYGMILIAAVTASNALAQNSSGLYVGLGYGDFASQIDTIGDVDIDFDADDDAFKLFAGWRFNPYLAAELNYIDFGAPAATVDALAIRADATGWAPYVIATLPLGNWELFAKGGLVFYDAEVRANGFGIADRGRDVAYGGGVGLTLLERLHLRAEYERLEISELDEAEAVWISASWRF
jgi:hypothetical protein